MGLMDKLKDFINAPVEEDEDDYGMEEPTYNTSKKNEDYEDISSYSRSPERRSAQRSSAGSSYGSQSGYSRSEQSYSAPERSTSERTASERRSKVVNLNGGGQLQMVLVKPERFEDGISIADHLNAKRTVVLNLESANREVVRRLVDFLSGVAYANDGQLKRVANATFVITPNTVDVMGDLLMEELENSGGYNF